MSVASRLYSRYEAAERIDQIPTILDDYADQATQGSYAGISWHRALGTVAGHVESAMSSTAGADRGGVVVLVCISGCVSVLPAWQYFRVMLR